MTKRHSNRVLDIPNAFLLIFLTMERDMETEKRKRIFESNFFYIPDVFVPLALTMKKYREKMQKVTNY